MDYDYEFRCNLIKMYKKNLSAYINELIEKIEYNEKLLNKMENKKMKPKKDFTYEKRNKLVPKLTKHSFKK